MVTQHADRINQMVRLAKIRKEKGITLADMAFRLGLNSVSLSRYEKGSRKVPLDVFEKYAGILGYDVKLLLK